MPVQQGLYRTGGIKFVSPAPACERSVHAVSILAVSGRFIQYIEALTIIEQKRNQVKEKAMPVQQGLHGTVGIRFMRPAPACEWQSSNRQILETPASRGSTSYR